MSIYENYGGYVACKNRDGIPGCAQDYDGGYSLTNCLKNCVQCGSSCTCMDPIAHSADALPTCPANMMPSWTNMAQIQRAPNPFHSGLHIGVI